MASPYMKFANFLGENVQDSKPNGQRIRMTQCDKCGRAILWNDRLHKYIDAKPFGDEMVPIVREGGKYIIHNDSCPVKIRERIEANCSWCLLEKKTNILHIGSKFGFMFCDKHQDETVEIQYRGKTFKRNRATLNIMYNDALKEKRRHDRKAKRPDHTATIETFLSKDADGI